jgi:hypothetical protein
VATTLSSSTSNAKLVAEISLTKACLMVIECLSKEEDWKVLKLVLVQVRTFPRLFGQRSRFCNRECRIQYYELSSDTTNS